MSSSSPEHNRLVTILCVHHVFHLRQSDSLNVLVLLHDVLQHEQLSEKGSREEVASVKSQTLPNSLTKGRLLNPPHQSF